MYGGEEAYESGYETDPFGWPIWSLKRKPILGSFSTNWWSSSLIRCTTKRSEPLIRCNGVFDYCRCQNPHVHVQRMVSFMFVGWCSLLGLLFLDMRRVFILMWIDGQLWFCGQGFRFCGGCFLNARVCSRFLLYAFSVSLCFSQDSHSFIPRVL